MSKLFVPFRMHKSGWFVAAFCFTFGVSLYGLKDGLTTGALLLASLLLHEVGHMTAASLLGVPVHEFGLQLAGAYTKRAYATRRRDECLISFAGPLANICSAFPMLFLHRIGAEVAICNLLLAIVNLLPIPASDGARILRTIKNSGTPGTVSPIQTA